MLHFSRTVEIEWGDCDASGLMHTERYFALFDGNLWRMLEQVLEQPMGRVLGAFGASGFPTVDLRGNFPVRSTLGDILEIETTITALRRSSFDVTHRARKGDELHAEGFDTRVWVRRSGEDPTRIEAQALPTPLVDSFREGRNIRQ
jgi:4-hydroxybenzoyl-CoA thioesterase